MTKTVLLLTAASTPEDGDVRLVNVNDSTNMTGRLEIYYDGQWGTVCDDFLDNSTAKVVCRQLGFNPDGAMAVFRAGYGQGVDPIWLDDVICDGLEENISSCLRNSWGINDCTHFEDAGVICVCKLYNKSTLIYVQLCYVHSKCNSYTITHPSTSSKWK